MSSNWLAPGARPLALLLLAALLGSVALPASAAAAGLALPSRLSDLCAAVDGQALPADGFSRQVGGCWCCPRPPSSTWHMLPSCLRLLYSAPPLTPAAPLCAHTGWQDLGPMRRLQTLTANWGYFRC